MQETIEVLEKLGEDAQAQVLQFARSLAWEDYEDNLLWDQGVAEDDGSFSTDEELRAKYGV